MQKNDSFPWNLQVVRVVHLLEVWGTLEDHEDANRVSREFTEKTRRASFKIQQKFSSILHQTSSRFHIPPPSHPTFHIHFKEQSLFPPRDYVVFAQNLQSNFNRCYQSARLMQFAR
jgi:hypothetical protein